jgi:hypothetical protein
LAARTLGNAFQGWLVVSALALGLILGARVVRALAGERDPPARPRAGHDFDEAAPVAAAEPTARRGT